MKSAAFEGIFQRVCVWCEQTFAKGWHFPSELAESRSISTNSSARQTPLKVRQSVGFVFEPKCGWYRGNFLFFRPNSLLRIGTFFV